MPLDRNELYREWFANDAELPTVRIQKVTIDNLKSVKHGEVVFACADGKFVPENTVSDILGVYGQNGSGKTTLIEALAMLEFVMAGEELPSQLCECISINADFARLSFLFDLQYPNKDVRKVEYSFSVKAEMRLTRSRSSFGENGKDSDDEPEMKAVIFDELIRVKGFFDGIEERKWKTVCDTSAKYPIHGPIPRDKKSPFFDDKTMKSVTLLINKRMALEKSQSFIFMTDNLKMMKSGMKDYCPRMLKHLQLFADRFLFVISTRSTAFIRSKSMIPFHTFDMGTVPFPSRGESFSVSKEAYGRVENRVNNVNTVLSQLVPGLNVKLEKRGETATKDGKPAYFSELMSIRTDSNTGEVVEFPFRYESDGVRRIFSLLNLIIAAYNQKSLTIAIDELDAGVYEYLLGEILEVFQDSGKGQFIFTSHNLRPLEVLNRKFIIFTTTNPMNRYYRMKNISTTSNLRTTYFREILLGEQDEELYNRTKEYKIESAFFRAGKEVLKMNAEG